MRVIAKTDSYIIMTDFPTSQEVEKRTGRGSQAQKQWSLFLEMEFRPFVPKETGALERSATLHSDWGAGQIIYATPYARRLYHNPQFQFSKNVNPMAGAYWDRRAAMVRMQNFWKPEFARIVAQAITGD